MEKKIYALAVLMSLSLIFGILPIVPTEADVYMPPGPPRDMSEWIYQGLSVYDLQWPCCTPIDDVDDLVEVGWKYTDGPVYDPATQIESPKVEWWDPEPQGLTWVQFSTWVMVFGVFPGVIVSPDQVPPPVVLVIEWNGIPYAVTLQAQDVVGMQYPPTKYGDPCPYVPEGIRDKLPVFETVYPWVYPVECEGAEEWKKAYYNVWYGDWDCATGPMPPGLYFWYIFHPNVGDWIAFNCDGWTKHPWTYDIYGHLEYSTSTIWLNHKVFDVRLLEVHKEIEPDWLPSGSIWGAPEVSNILTITNVGKVPAHDIDITESFPTEPKEAIIPKWDTATIKIFGGRHIYATPLLIREAVGTYGWPYKLPPPFDVLYPGETMVISMEASVNVDQFWDGVFVVEAMVSACEIPPWKYPRAMDILYIGLPGQPVLSTIPPSDGFTSLWSGPVFIEEIGRFLYISVQVPLPVIWNEIPQTCFFEWTLDPVPVDLNGDGIINALDVALVRKACVGLLPYNMDMDVNANSKIDTEDLAAFKLAAEG
jgi:hypothetical protein